MKISDLESAVKYLKSFTSYEDIILHKYDESKFDLKRFRSFLRVYGVPCEKLRAIHIAGSKGKGTTASLVAGYLQRAGYKVGLFTSPYVIDITEGIKVNGKAIPVARFLRYVNGLKRFIEGVGLEGRCAGNAEHMGGGLATGGQMVTYFELLTTIMFQYFLDTKVDFAVLEVGLGGRLDSTNVCKPIATVLTSIEKEHERLLGNTYAKILREKLGIVKKGVPLIVSPQKPLVEREIRRKRLGERFGVKVIWAAEIGASGDPNFEGAKACLGNLSLRRLIGKFDEKLFLKLYHQLSIVGRFEVHKFAGGKRVAVFDIAHTIGSAKYLRGKLNVRFPDKRFVFLISMMKDKHVDGFLNGLVGKGSSLRVGHSVIFTSSHPVRGYTGGELRRGFYKSAKVEERPVVAFEAALKNLKSDQVLVVTGSHFLVGEILRAVKKRLI